MAGSIIRTFFTDKPNVMSNNRSIDKNGQADIIDLEEVTQRTLKDLGELIGTTRFFLQRCAASDPSSAKAHSAKQALKYLIPPYDLLNNSHPILQPHVTTSEDKEPTHVRVPRP